MSIWRILSASCAGCRTLSAIIARSNLAILEEAGKSHLPEFFRANDVDIVSSMPCYLESNVAAQRGGGVYEKNVRVLKRLNSLGYGTGKHRLDLVYNPGGAFLPGPQGALEADYKENLGNDFGIRFDNLLTIANMPIGRFRTDLEQAGQLAGYLELLEDSFNAHNLGQVMCRSQISVDWQGRMYDCDFNQALGQTATEARIGAVSARELVGLPITCGDHACVHGWGTAAAAGTWKSTVFCAGRSKRRVL
jgi:radical SAM/Cys-rich protein